MRVFISTNVLISAALFPGGMAAAYARAVSAPCFVTMEMEETEASQKTRVGSSLDMMHGFP